jgi:hypothetical protein
MNIVSCYLTRFFLGVEKVLATYSRVMMWAYIPFALCVLLYVLCFTIEVGSFAVNITDEELQNIVESVGMKDVAEVAYFRRVIHRQSVAVDIFTDSAVDLSMIMFYMPPIFLLLVARNGRVPCFLMGGERGVKWLPWITVCFLVFASMGLAVRSAFDLLVSSQKLIETEQFLIELFQSEPGIAIVDLFARRRALAACSILLLVAVMVIAISFLVIPFLRVLWAKRYRGGVQENEGSVLIDTVK